MFQTPTAKVLARISGFSGAAFVVAELVAATRRDPDFKINTTSATLELVAVVLFATFMIALRAPLEIWEREGDPSAETPATDATLKAGFILCSSLLAAAILRLAAARASAGWLSDAAVAIDQVSLVPLLAFVAFLSAVVIRANAPSGVAVGGWFVAIAGLVRALGAFITEGPFAAGGVIGTACFALFGIWVGVVAILALRIRV